MEIRHRGNVRYGEPHLRDHWADCRFTAQSLAAAETGVWATASLLPLVVHVDPHGRIDGPFPAPSPYDKDPEIGRLAVDGAQLWLGWSQGIARFDPETGRQESVRVSGHGLSVGEGAVWTMSRNRLVRIDRRTLSAKAIARLGRGETGLVVASHGLVWVMIRETGERSTLVRVNPRDEGRVDSTAIAGSPHGLMRHREGVVARVWRRKEDRRHFDDVLVSFGADGVPVRERVIAPTGVDAALVGDDLWLSGRDPFDEHLRGLPSVMRRVPADDDREELIATPGTVDRLASGPHTLWGRLDEHSAERAFGSVLAIGEDRAVQRTSLTEIEVAAHLPPPPPAIEATPTEERVRNRLAGSLFGGWRSARPDAGEAKRRPYIRGVTIEDVRLEGSFPNTWVVVLFRAEQSPGTLFGRRRRIWEDSGELSGVIEVMDVNLMEDVEACGYGLPAEPKADPTGVCWF